MSPKAAISCFVLLAREAAKRERQALHFNCSPATIAYFRGRRDGFIQSARLLYRGTTCAKTVNFRKQRQAVAA